MAWWDWGWEQQPQSWEWRSSSDWWSGEWWSDRQAALDERAAWRWQEEEDWRTARWWQEEEDKKAALAKRAAEQEAGVEAEGKGKKGEGKGEEGKKRKKKGRNNKNRALGSGTVSNVRRLEFQKKGLKASLNREREAQGLPPLESLEELLEAQKEGKKEEEEEEEEMEEEEEEKEQGERKKVTLVPAAARELGPSEKQSQEATSSSSSTLLDTTLDKREKKAKAPVEAAENRAVELKAALAERVAEGAKSKAPPPNLREAPSESPDEGAALAERAAPSDSGSGRNKGEKKKVEKKKWRRRRLPLLKGRPEGRKSSKSRRPDSTWTTRTRTRRRRPVLWGRRAVPPCQTMPRWRHRRRLGPWAKQSPWEKDQSRGR